MNRKPEIEEKVKDTFKKCLLIQPLANRSFTSSAAALLTRVKES